MDYDELAARYRAHNNPEDELTSRYRAYTPQDDSEPSSRRSSSTYRPQDISVDDELAARFVAATGRSDYVAHNEPVEDSYVMSPADYNQEYLQDSPYQTHDHDPWNQEAQEILEYPTEDLFYQEPENIYNHIDSDSFIQDDPEEWTIESIRALTIPVGRKLQMERKIEDRLRSQKSGNRRNRIAKTVANVKRSVRTFALFKNALKAVEVKSGTSVMSFFLFIQWLSFLNLLIFVLTLAFMIVPNFFHYREIRVECVNASTTLDWCTKNPFYWLDIIQGTGVLEKTPLFYGNYTNEVIVYETFGTTWRYDMPLVYVGITITYFLLSVAVVISGAVKSFGENMKDVESKYCNLVLARWNFHIGKEGDAQEKHERIYREITFTLEGDRAEEERKRRVEANAIGVRVVRVVVNLLVLAVLVGAAAAVSRVFAFSAERKDDVGEWWFLQVGTVYEFLPSLTIVALNITVPFIFDFLTAFENYSPMFAIRVTLMRTVVLRLFSLVVLLVSLANKITDDTSPLPCWETYVGQQFYKLAVTDFLIQLIATFIIAPLRLLASRCLPFLAEPTFNLPKNVLDVVYLQTICWLGTYYVPFLPALFCLVFLAMFHIKKFICLHLTRANPIIDKTSNANSMFMVVLLICLVFAMLPIVYSIGELRPSEQCGPFRGENSTWIVVVDAFQTTPAAVQDFVFFLGTEAFAIPIIVVLMLTIYYYLAKISTNSRIIENLQKRIGQDKTKRLLQSKIREYEKFYSQ